MREGREGFRSSQLDLFAWRERDGDSAETVGHGGRPRDALQPARTEPRNVAAMTREVLLGALEARFDDPTGASRDLVLLIAEVERRREATAAPLLVRVCRRHAGFDRSRTVTSALVEELDSCTVGYTATGSIRYEVPRSGGSHGDILVALGIAATLHETPFAAQVTATARRLGPDRVIERRPGNRHYRASASDIVDMRMSESRREALEYAAAERERFRAAGWGTGGSGHP